ncbi:hypothetical protein [Undibacterium sp. TS12]|uniref:hypothetical protein n=1 Tax=Undibacterium sp. TS12 TaxID=2908202 RepID=UPI001F4CD521|nr:hypothetical protein [Undibacterium sp. TS12]MCH8618949.1 hypothetical protein [Undibacterium sp. TS12]
MEHDTHTAPKPQLRSMLMIVLWPAFLMACAATGLFFSLVDPMELIILDHRLQMHEMGVYTVGFFAFWMLGILSSGLTALLVQKAH